MALILTIAATSLLFCIESQDIIQSGWSPADFLFDTLAMNNNVPGLNGWHLYNWDKNIGPVSIQYFAPPNTTIQGNFQLFHGPIYNLDPFPFTIMSRQYKVIHTGSLFISFTIVWCATDSSNNNHVRLCSTAGCQTQIEIDFTTEAGLPFTDTTFQLNANQKYVCDPNPFEYNYFDDISMGTVIKDIPFIIRFEIDVFALSIDQIHLFNISFNFIPDPTAAPTSTPSQPPSITPSVIPTKPPSNSPSLSPTKIPSIAPSNPPTIYTGPTPAPTPSDNIVYLDKTGCDCVNSTCHNQSVSCLTINYGWYCLLGIISSCNMYGNDGNGEIKLGDGSWYWPYQLTFTNAEIIINGNGRTTDFYYNGSNHEWIGCGDQTGNQCWLELTNLDLYSSRNSNNDKQININSGTFTTLLIKNVIFNGNNYNINTFGNPFWIISGQNSIVLFQDCVIRDNNVFYQFIDGAYITFKNCEFIRNVDNGSVSFVNTGNNAMFYVNNATVIFDTCLFRNNDLNDRGLIQVVNNGILTITQSNITLTRGTSSLIIINQSTALIERSHFYKQNNGPIRTLIDIYDVITFNSFICPSLNNSKIKIINNNFVNNNVDKLLNVIGTSVFIANNSFGVGNVCINGICSSLLDTSLNIDGLSKYKLAFNHGLINQQLSLCITDSDPIDILPLIIFDNVTNINNTNVLFYPCTDEFSFGNPAAGIFPPSTNNIDVVHNISLPGASVLQTLTCNSSISTCNILCTASVACFGSEFVIEASTVNIYCAGTFACSNILVDAFIPSNQTGTELNVVCRDSNSCADMILVIDGYDTVTLKCARVAACESLNITIIDSTDSVITCIAKQSCSGLYIKTDNVNTTLIMTQYSEGVVLSNPIGYNMHNLNCDPANSYIVLDQSYEAVNTSLDDLYGIDEWPCSNVQFICNVTQSCDVNYIQDYENSVVDNFYDYMNCYGPVYTSDLLDIQCLGTCPQSPTTSPTVSPTPEPTSATKEPSIAPSNMPTSPPSKSPSASPSKSPSNSPSFIPSDSPTQPPSNAPSINPSLTPTQPPTNFPSLYPSGYPTQPPSLTPSSTPTFLPSDTPSISPTLSPVSQPSNTPSVAPSVVPTNIPSNTPSISPTQPPSISPSFSPSMSPTQPPSNMPTIVPSMSPSMTPSVSPSDTPTFPPSMSPSNNPSLSPSLTPSLSPSTSPSSSPLSQSDFDSFIIIEYILEELSNSNIILVANNPFNVTNYVAYIIKKHYYLDEVISYENYMIDIIDINDVAIEDVGVKQRTEWVGDGSGDAQLNLTANIECNSVDGVNYCASIQGQSQDTNSFASDVTDELRLYFVNNKLLFSVKDADKLEIICKDCSEPLETSFDYFLPVLGSIVFVLIVIGICAFLFNKHLFPKVPGFNVVDDGKYTSIFIFALQFYDFASDINLSMEIWNSPQLFNNILILISAIGSTFFVIIPYIANLMIAANIKNLIKHNAAAKAWFQSHTPVFTLLVVLCGGSYSALAVVSSRIFGLKIFNSGLTQYELKKMGKLKVIGTVLIENIPQLFCQILYSYSLRDITDGVALAFVASLLSVTASTLSYLIERDQSDTKVVQYYLKTTCSKRIKKPNSPSEDNLDESIDDDLHLNLDVFDKKGKGINFTKQQTNKIDKQITMSNNDTTITKKEKKQFIDNRGRTQHLAESIGEVFGISPKNIEIGYSMLTKYGIITHVIHFVYQDDIDSLQEELLNDNITVTPIFYTERLYTSAAKEINNIFVEHFKLKYNDEFTVEYINKLSFSGRTLSVHNKRKSNLLKKMASQLEMINFQTNINELNGSNEIKIALNTFFDKNNIQNNNKKIGLLSEILKEEEKNDNDDMEDIDDIDDMKTMDGLPETTTKGDTTDAF